MLSEERRKQLVVIGGGTLILLGSLFLLKDKIKNFVQRQNSTVETTTTTHKTTVQRREHQMSHREEKRNTNKKHTERASSATVKTQTKTQNGQNLKIVGEPISPQELEKMKKSGTEYASQPRKNVDTGMCMQGAIGTQINEEEIARKVIKLLLNDKELRDKFFETVLGIENISKYAIDISQFEARKKVMERDIQLLKLLIQKQKLQREYQELLNPPPKVVIPKEIQRLDAEIAMLKSQIAQLQQNLAELSSNMKKSVKETKKNEGFEIKVKPSPEDILKNYLGKFTAVIKMGNTTYVYTSNGNFFPVGSVLPDGAKILKANISYIEIEKDGVKVKVPIGAEKAKGEKGNLPF